MQKTWINDVSYNKEMWTERIDGMVVYTPTELEERLYEAGFSSISTIRKKDEIHIISHK